MCHLDQPALVGDNCLLAVLAHYAATSAYSNSMNSLHHCWFFRPTSHCNQLCDPLYLLVSIASIISSAQCYSLWNIDSRDGRRSSLTHLCSWWCCVYEFVVRFSLLLICKCLLCFCYTLLLQIVHVVC